MLHREAVQCPQLEILVEEVLEEYPALTHEDILQCLRFSSELMKHQYSLVEVV